MGRQVPRSRQVPSLTLHDTLHPNSRHVSIGCHVLRGRQVPDDRWVPSLTCATRSALTVGTYQLAIMYQGVIRYPSVVKHFPFATRSTLMVVMYQLVIIYQGVVRYPTVVRYLP